MFHTSRLFVLLILGSIFTSFSVSDIQAQDKNEGDIKSEVSHFYDVDPPHSYLGFRVKFAGFSTVRGRFPGIKGTFYYDEYNISKTSVTIIIDVTSIETSNDSRDKDLRSDNWFDAGRYPSARFQSTKTEKYANGLHITGDLTIKETTKEVILVMDTPSDIIFKPALASNHRLGFHGTLKVKRKDFGVQGNDFFNMVVEGIAGVANEISLEFDILGLRDEFSTRKLNEISQKIVDTAMGKNGKEAVGVFKTAKDNATEDSPFLSFSSAMRLPQLLMAKGNQNAAIDLLKYYDETYTEYSENSEVKSVMGQAYFLLDDLYNSKLKFQSALEMDQENTSAIEWLRLVGRTGDKK